MRKYERIDENLGAASVELTDDEFNKIEQELDKIKIHGNRTDEDIQKWDTLKLNKEVNYAIRKIK